MIMNYEGILEFKGTWRRYQARVLEHADRYMADGKIHIVAAPGSGKTTLGIELIRRMNGKALILAPSITIREQWIARIEEAFLCEGWSVSGICQRTAGWTDRCYTGWTLCTYTGC